MASVLAGKYQLHESLGAGGFSRVMRATHIGMGREVAIKFLDLDAAVQASNTSAERIRQRFSREAKLSSQLKHPNSITVYDFGEERGNWYIVMELVDGVTLHQALRGGPMLAERAAMIARDIAHSLAEAHHLGFLHRDLKPTNVMLTEDFTGDEVVKVLDFGIATVVDVDAVPAGFEQMDATRSGTFVGTPRYAAPEQFLSEPLTPAADLYSLGLLLWEMVVGTPAVPTGGFAECLKAHLSPSPWRLPAGTTVEEAPEGEGLAEIIHRALQKAPEDRYTSAASFADDLDRWLDGEQPAFAASTVLNDWSPTFEASYDPLLSPDQGRLTFDPNLDESSEPEFLRREVPAAAEPVVGQRGGLSSIPKFKEQKIELDLDAVESVRARAPRPTAEQLLVTDAAPTDRDGTSALPVTKIMIGVGLFAALIFVVSSLRPEPEPPLKIDVDDITRVELMHLEEFEKTLREPEAAIDNVFPTEEIVGALEVAGWSVRKLPDAQTLANTHEQGYRIQREPTSMEIRVVTATSRHIAQTMFEQTKAPLSAVLLDNKLVRIFPPHGKSHPDVSSVAATLRAYRDAVRSDREERP